MEGGDEEIQIVDSKDFEQQSKAFDKLTDHVEDRQLDSTRVQEVQIFNHKNTYNNLSDVLMVIGIFLVGYGVDLCG